MLKKIATTTLLCTLAGLLFVESQTQTAHSEQAAAPAAPAAAPATNADDWLLNAPDDTARFKLLQQQARGFSASMFEVSRRFDTLYDAVNDKNYEFSAYQWQKIKEVIQAGYTRRPKRQANADAVFLNPLFDPVLADFKAADADKAWAAFSKACHEAEKVKFINDQPLFRRTEKPKG
jgi:hypothetical protein